MLMIDTLIGDCSEEVFDFSSGQMTQAKIVELKQAYNSDFALIFQVTPAEPSDHSRRALSESTDVLVC